MKIRFPETTGYAYVGVSDTLCRPSSLYASAFGSYTTSSDAGVITINTEPSRHTNCAHFFFCRHAIPVAEQKLDASEHIRVVPVPLRDLWSSIERGEIFHGVHVAAILLAAHRGLIRL